MLPIMDLDHQDIWMRRTTDCWRSRIHWKMCQGVHRGEYRVKGCRVGTVDGVLLDYAKNCTKETRQCGKVLGVCK
jgi:hypothetical protein